MTDFEDSDGGGRAGLSNDMGNVRRDVKVTDPRLEEKLRLELSHAELYADRHIVFDVFTVCDVEVVAEVRIRNVIS